MITDGGHVVRRALQREDFVGIVLAGLTKQYSSPTERFEVDSANAARDFLRQHGIDEASIEVVWDAIALHTTPGIPKHKKPEVALVTAGVDMDVLGIGYLDVPDAQREAIVQAHPRGDHFNSRSRSSMPFMMDSATNRKPPGEP